MNKMIRVMMLILAMASFPLSAMAQSSPLDFLISSLEGQGYKITEVSRTWLGRVVIEAETDRHEREIVLDPISGEILRDYWERRDDDEVDHDDEEEGKSWFLFLFKPSRGGS
ncbi:MAG: hypothetical protein P8Q99_01995 [Paracoccaceae bacterium]|nr:hypothetical protein [Paracoccaceae bacterium]